MKRGMLVLSLAGLVACDAPPEDQTQVSSTKVVQRPYVAIPPGSLPRGAGERAAAIALPGPPATAELTARGRDRFLIFCAPCHGNTGRGDGPVVGRGFPPPPSLLEERLRKAPPDHVVAVITNGRGRMSPYADRLDPRDRWAVAHYIGTLQADMGAWNRP